ncbi:hypothetical protein DHOM_07020 [Dermabacter hominis 1368]|uniref:Reverse transcriptase domain-containing protein n=1 Tax=Dermabacter hominis 1368 TaxID=1450519 RepID=A0ABR4SJ75_9MICO|nr:hypothetical protein DHOM_07020 [Dermabacter hominis 1368]
MLLIAIDIKQCFDNFATHRMGLRESALGVFTRKLFDLLVARELFLHCINIASARGIRNVDSGCRKQFVDLFHRLLKRSLQRVAFTAGRHSRPTPADNAMERLLQARS